MKIEEMRRTYQRNKRRVNCTHVMASGDDDSGIGDKGYTSAESAGSQRSGRGEVKGLGEEARCRGKAKVEVMRQGEENRGRVTAKRQGEDQGECTMRRGKEKRQCGEIR